MNFGWLLSYPRYFMPERNKVQGAWRRTHNRSVMGSLNPSPLSSVTKERGKGSQFYLSSSLFFPLFFSLILSLLTFSLSLSLSLSSYSVTFLQILLHSLTLFFFCFLLSLPQHYFEKPKVIPKGFFIHHPTSLSPSLSLSLHLSTPLALSLLIHTTLLMTVLQPLMTRAGFKCHSLPLHQSETPPNQNIN